MDHKTERCGWQCPACHHEHAVGTTCRECRSCLDGDLTNEAERVFADQLPGGAAEREALARHNESLRVQARCDADCGFLDCRAASFDAAGLTQHRRTPADEGPPHRSERRADRPVFGRPTRTGR